MQWCLLQSDGRNRIHNSLRQLSKTDFNYSVLPHPIIHNLVAEMISNTAHCFCTVWTLAILVQFTMLSEYNLTSNHSPPSSGKVKNVWRYTIQSPNNQNIWEWCLCALRLLNKKRKLTFQNRVPYILDWRTATLQMLDFLYFFQQI
jgi:hypothetical protein